MVIPDIALRRHKEQDFTRKIENWREELFIRGILLLCRTGK